MTEQGFRGVSSSPELTRKNVTFTPMMESKSPAEPSPRFVGASLSPLSAARAFLRRKAPTLRYIAMAIDGLSEEVRRGYWRRVRHHTIAAWLAEPRPRRLHIGAGAIALQGWLNTDIDPAHGPPGIVFLDATRRFPLPDDCADFVFSEHMIEHINYEQGLGMLRECRRVLCRGGILRIATPDLSELLALHRRPLSAVQEEYIRYIVDHSIRDCPRYDPIFVINNAFRAWGHCFLYDEATLRASIEEAGFVNVARYPMGESSTAALTCLESHGKRSGHQRMAAFETMCFEASCPTGMT